jgi:alkylglycerol monooxygenase
MDFNPIVLSIPIFFILIGIELLIQRFSHKKLYRLQDALTNISCGITQQLSGLFLRILAIGVYQVVFHYFALFTLERTWLYWIALFLLVDLAYYWAHRMSHEVNLFWGGHVVHHQSEDYNLSVALRQSSFQVVWTFAFSLPIAVMGFNTIDFALMSAFNTLYQFWIHTETIGKMGWFEKVFNTPSHHRVHHGRDPKYIDKNHAGTLIIWDKMFGTFQEEEERPTYGITKPINSWNPVWANFSYYAEMVNEIKQIPVWRDRIKYIFAKPGWLPDYMGGYRPAPAIEKLQYQKYDTPSHFALNFYVMFQYLVALVATSLFLFNQDQFNWTEKAIITSLIIILIMNCGALFENKQWVWWLEFFRIIMYSGAWLFIAYFNQLNIYQMGGAIVYGLISLSWFIYLKKHAFQ